MAQTRKELTGTHRRFERLTQMTNVMAAVTIGCSLFLAGLYLGISESIEHEKLLNELQGVRFSGGFSLHQDMYLRYIFLSGLLTVLIIFQRRTKILANIIGTLILAVIVFQTWVLQITKPVTLFGHNSRIGGILGTLWFMDFLVPAFVAVLVFLHIFSVVLIWRSYKCNMVR